MSDPLIEFLNARLDETEATARRVRSTALPYLLRDVEAKREILAAYIKVESDGIRGDGWIALRFAVEALAGAYWDHPDYRPEWAS